MPARSSDTQPSLRPARERRMRDGTNPIERKAVYRVQLDLAALSASLVVQLALCRLSLAEWARGERVPDTLVYNMFSRRRPYRRVRQLLAAQLGVDVCWVDHLIEASRSVPSLHRPPDPFASFAAVPPWPTPPERPGPRPWLRDGSNPIEIRARFRVEQDIASFAASDVVKLALWPRTLSGWGREVGIRWEQKIYDALGGWETEPEVREKLASSLGAPRSCVDALIDEEPAPPPSLVPREPPPLVTPEPPVPVSKAPTAPRSRTRRPGSAPRAMARSVVGLQLSLPIG